MSILNRRDVIRLLIISTLLLLPVTSRAQQSPPIVEKLGKTTVWSRLGRSRRSVTPSVHSFRASMFPEAGFGSRSATRLPMTGRINRASR